MKATVYQLFAGNDEHTEFLLNSYEMPTMEDVDVDEYRGYTIIVNTYEVELTDETILEITGIDASELEYMTIEDMALEISEDQLIDYIQSEGIEAAREDVMEELSRLNATSDRLIDEVMDELAFRLGRERFKKYDHINGRSIRIANHTHNPMNGKCDINVVIAEKDQTSSKFNTAREDLVFCNNADVNDIVEAILNF